MSLPPGSPSVRRLLDERARLLARPLATAADAGDLVDVVTFHLAGERFALATRYLVEVGRRARLTALPGAAPPLHALTAWRGELLTVFDLAALLGLGPPPAAERGWLLVLGEERPRFGVLADALGEFRTLSPRALGPAPTGEGSPYLLGLADDALVVLDGDALLRIHS